jgi:hypothetical protein
MSTMVITCEQRELLYINVLGECLAGTLSVHKALAYAISTRSPKDGRYTLLRVR